MEGYISMWYLAFSGAWGIKKHIFLKGIMQKHTKKWLSSSLIPPPPVAWSPWSSWQVIPIKAQKIFMTLIWHDSLEDISGSSKVCQTHATQNSEHLQPLEDPGKMFFFHTSYKKKASLPTTNHHHQSPITGNNNGTMPDSPFYKALVPGLECNGKPLMRRRLVGLGVVVGCREGWLRRDGSGCCCCCCCCVFYGEFLFRPEIPLLNILRHRILVQIEIDIYLALYPTQKHGSVENGG